MAKNREPVKPVESESETESGEEEETDASSDESDSEPEQTQLSNKPSSSAPKAIQSHPSDDEESGSETESENDLPPKIKPTASRPMDDPSNNSGRNPKPKPNPSEFTTPTKITSAKRLAEYKETETKRSKKNPGIESSEKKPNDDPKKVLFQRLWSEDDEIAILEGMIDYASKNKSDPVADLNAFHDLIKANLHVDVTRAQLQDKIRRLKKKYTNNKSKEKQGKEKTFSKPHEQKAYELSKKIWGSEKENVVDEVMGSVVRKPPVKRVTMADDVDANVNAKALSNGGKDSSGTIRVESSVEARILAMGAGLFEGGKGLRVEQEWKKLKVKEIEVHLMQLDVNRARAKLVLDALKSSSSSSH